MKSFEDKWALKAKKEGYRSRAAFKLAQIDKKYHLISNARSILELGSAPGGWSQLIAKKKHQNSVCFAVDILPMEPVSEIKFFQLDLLSIEFNELVQNLDNKLDLIVSDMSVNLSGIKVVDDESNLEINLFSLQLARDHLNVNGNLLIKTFNNQNLTKLKKEFSLSFNEVQIEKPPASKTSSSEVYLLGLDLK